MPIYSCISAFLHVEHVGQDIVATEVEEAEAEGLEQQPQEFEVADQVEEQALDSNSANPDLQQGKHQINSTQCLTYFKFMQLLIPVHLS